MHGIEFIPSLGKHINTSQISLHVGRLSAYITLLLNMISSFPINEVHEDLLRA